MSSIYTSFLQVCCGRGVQQESRHADETRAGGAYLSPGLEVDKVWQALGCCGAMLDKMKTIEELQQRRI
jgi:hypothetical protein